MYLLTALFVFPALLAAQALPRLPSTTEVPRFLEIDEGLYRGGQPTREGFEFLKQLGVKTIINLRTDNGEETIVRELGMNYVHIPVSLTFWSDMPDPAIEDYFEVLNDPANYPIFFHCRRGADRTGALAALYRLSAQGWDSKSAYSEAREIGMGWWFPMLKKQIYDYGENGSDLPDSGPPVYNGL